MRATLAEVLAEGRTHGRSGPVEVRDLDGLSAEQLLARGSREAFAKVARRVAAERKANELAVHRAEMEQIRRASEKDDEESEAYLAAGKLIEQHLSEENVDDDEHGTDA